MVETDLPQIPLPNSAFEALTILVRNRGNLRKIVEHADMGEPAGDVRKLAKRIAAEIGAQPSDVRGVLSSLLQLEYVRGRHELDPDRLVVALTNSIDVSDNEAWKAKYKEAWSEMTGDLVAGTQLVAKPNNAIDVSNKAEVLTWSHQNVVLSSRIVTDVRPVFDADGENILLTAITHSLQVTYTDGSEQRRIALALDASDLTELKSACQRAEGKAVAAAKAYSSHKPFVPPGDP